MKTTKQKGLTDKSELAFYIALISIPVLQVIIFYFYVNFNSITMSFFKYSMKNDTYTWNNFANFIKFWDELTNGQLLVKFLNSIYVWIFSSLLGTFLSVLFSYYIFKKFKGAKVFKFILFLPTVLPSILLAFMYKFFMNEAIPTIIENITGNPTSALLGNPSIKFPLVVFYNVFVCFGAQILIYSGAMDQISPDILEAGQVDGVSPVREFFSLVIPMVLPTVSTFFIASVATIFTNQANLYSFYGHLLENEYQTLGYYLVLLVNGEQYGEDFYTYASALGIVCTLVAFPLTVLVRRLLTPKEEY